MTKQYIITAQEIREFASTTLADVDMLIASLPLVQDESLAKAWGEGYQQGVEDERTSEANIGIAGFGAKVRPARNNPYGTTPQAQPPKDKP